MPQEPKDIKNTEHMENSDISTPNPIPEIQTAQTAPTPSQKPLRRFRILRIIFASFAVILIIGGIGVYLLLKQLIPSTGNNTKQTNQQATQILNNPLVQKLTEKLPIPKLTIIPITVTISPTSPILPTSTTNKQKQVNWKTYQNTTDTFSLNYPENETIQESPHGLGVTEIVFYNPQNGSNLTSPDYHILLFPKSIGNLIGQNFDQLYNLPTPSAQIIQNGTTSQQFTKLQNRTIAGLRAIDYQSTANPPQANEEPEAGAYIEIGDNTLAISTAQSNKSTLQTMLATFRYPL